MSSELLTSSVDCRHLHGAFFRYIASASQKVKLKKNLHCHLHALYLKVFSVSFVFKSLIISHFIFFFLIFSTCAVRLLQVFIKDQIFILSSPHYVLLLTSIPSLAVNSLISTVIPCPFPVDHRLQSAPLPSFSGILHLIHRLKMSNIASVFFGYLNKYIYLINWKSLCHPSRLRA